MAGGCQDIWAMVLYEGWGGMAMAEGGGRITTERSVAERIETAMSEERFDRAVLYCIVLDQA